MVSESTNLFTPCGGNACFQSRHCWLGVKKSIRIRHVKHWVIIEALAFIDRCKLLWPPYGIGQAIIFLPCDFYLLSSFFLAWSQRSEIGCLPYFHTWCGLRANLECMSEMRCTLLAENTRRKNRHFGTILQLCRAVSSQLRHVSTIGKNLLNNNTSSTCPDNMVNFGLLTAEICWRVWGTPSNFNGFRVLAALLHGTLVVGVSRTLRRWTEGTIYIRQGDHHVGHWPTF